MHFNWMMKTLLVGVMCVVLIFAGCTAQWLSVALADLPVLTQMALNIAVLVTTLESGKQLSAGESAAIQNISAAAGKDLALLQTLYNQYKTNPDSGTLQKIASTISDLNQNLPALVQAAKISDATVSARVNAAVNLILTTVNSFAQVIPQNSPPVAAARAAGAKLKIPEAKDLKNQWNQQVCAPGGNNALNGAVKMCVLR